jgi:hypothetical protein
MIKETTGPVVIGRGHTPCQLLNVDVTALPSEDKDHE